MYREEVLSAIVVILTILTFITLFTFMVNSAKTEYNCEEIFGNNYNSKSYFPFTFPDTIECYAQPEGRTSIVKIDNNTAQKIWNEPKLIHLR